jgi:hypothetical protein
VLITNVQRGHGVLQAPHLTDVRQSEQAAVRISDDGVTVFELRTWEMDKETVCS